ncbi:hypothetical protein [Exiguobacterium aurantiacum]|uniref:hypothetical protein n=1 Tax=Exiguobacterium aurantiacum TaxID=33987 RepID=UPI000877962B|nr:hypothetical protein [Exiguobacterium aurantiacum]
MNREGGGDETCVGDYHDSIQMAESVRQAVAERGGIDVIVAWIHSDAPDTRRWLTHEEIAGGVIMAIQESKLCHIVGVVD